MLAGVGKAAFVSSLRLPKAAATAPALPPCLCSAWSCAHADAHAFNDSSWLSPVFSTS